MCIDRVGIALGETVYRVLPDLAQQLRIFSKIIFLMWKCGAECLAKIVVSVGKFEAFAIYYHLVEKVGIHLHPRQIHQPHIGEKFMQHLPLFKSANVVKTSVEGQTFAAKCLQRTTDERIFFYHANALAVLLQYQSALQSAKSGANYYYVIFGHYAPIFFVVFSAIWLSIYIL